jgi:hypothetical protein
MGMFDYLKCDYHLPGEKVELVDEFQTKAFDCTLATMLITEEGRIVVINDPESRRLGTAEDVDHYTGTVAFYGSNVVASGPSGHYTRNGEDSEYVCFEATFVDGQLTEIEQTEYERHPVLSSKEMPSWDSYRKGSELNEEDSFLGQTLFVCWGGFGSIEDEDRGYEAEVVYETDKELCLKKKSGTLELVDRHQIGNCLFKDFDEAKANEDYLIEKKEEAKKEYERKLRERMDKE